MLSLLCVNVEILKRWNFANMCRLARAKMKAEPFSVNSLRQFLFNSKMEEVDVEEVEVIEVEEKPKKKVRRKSTKKVSK